MVGLACGGNDAPEPSSASVTTSSLGKPAYLKQANKTCSKEGENTLKEINSYLAKKDSKNIPERTLFAEMTLAVLVPSVAREIQAIRELGAPDGDEKQIEKALTAQMEALDAIKAGKTVTSVDEFEAQFTEASEKLRAYGFEVCLHSF